MNNQETNKLIQVGTLDKPEWIEARRRVYSPDGICPTLNGIGCGGNTEPKIMESNNKSQNELIQVGTLTGGIYDTSFDCIKRIYSTQGIAPTINTCGGGHREPKIIEDNNVSSTQRVYMKGINGCCLCNIPNSELTVPVYKTTIIHGCFVIVDCYVCETCLNKLGKEDDKRK